MISYITATNDLLVLETKLAGTLRLEGDDELVVITHPESIAAAYNEGQARAKNPVRCYVHHDVKVLNDSLRNALLAACTAEVGMVGLVGSRTPTVPWWEGRCCGSVIDGRMGTIHFGPGGECSYLDGLLLATAQPVEWDESIPGFHFYDTDMCAQMLDRGLPNWCLDRGDELVLHDTNGPSKATHITGWQAAARRFHEKRSELMDGPR